MEIVTITDEAKRAIAKLCNESVIVEYEMILSYPRIIDHIVNFEKIKDEQLVKDIDKLGKDSLRHFTKMDEMIRDLGDNMVATLALAENVKELLYVSWPVVLRSACLLPSLVGCRICHQQVHNAVPDIVWDLDTEMFQHGGFEIGS